jgi:beta-phosphoglucomutase family hydrolase
MILQPKAFIFDLNGTMIDDMKFHIKSWYQILNHLGAELSYDQVKEECYGKNHELLERIFPGRFSEEEKHRMSIEKEKTYQQEFKPHLKLIRGLGQLLKQTNKAGVKMAIGSAAIMYNIDFVLDGLGIRKYFDVIVSADDVSSSKPHPETYLKCADQLRLYPWECVVFEDSPKGIEAAANAGMKAVAITTMNKREDFDQYDNIIRFIDNYSELGKGKEALSSTV